MSIKRRHIREKLEKVIKEEIQKGKYPSTETINKRMSDEFDKHTPGLPKFKPIEAPKNGVSDPHDYNEMIDNIYDDLHMVFSETSSQAKRLLKNFDYGEVERNKILKRLERLSDNIDNLLLLAENTEGYLESLYDNFHDYSKVNMENTTANVDLSSREVTLSQIKSDGKKYSLRNRRYSINTLDEGSSIENIESFNNALDDYLNTAWLSKVTKKEKGPASIEVVINLTELDNDKDNPLADEIPVSSISFVDSSPDITNLSVMWSNDDINYFYIDDNKRSVDVIEKETFTCEETYMQYIKLILTKDKPDEQLSDGRYIYRFGAKGIDVKKVGFKEAGRFESKYLTIENTDETNPINQVALNVEDETPKFTSIDYFLRFPQSNGFIPISPIDDPNPKHQKVINLENISTPNPVNISGGNNNYLTHNGIDFYKLKTLEHTPRKNSVELFRGKNMWKKEEFNTSTYEGMDTRHNPIGKDWLNLPEDVSEKDIKKSFINATGNLSKDSSKGTMTRWTTYLYCSSTKVVKETMTTAGDINSNIILNGSTISIDENGKYVLRIPEGWNKIEILNYNIKDNSGSLNINFNPETIGKMIAENAPLQEVSLYDLKNNVLMNDNNKFAMDEDKIILNYNPDGINFEVSYSYGIANNFNEIKFAAELKREKDITDLTPRLKKYNIRIS